MTTPHAALMICNVIIMLISSGTMLYRKEIDPFLTFGFIGSMICFLGLVSKYLM